jgi:iron complex outermembrane receptor protein
VITDLSVAFNFTESAKIVITIFLIFIQSNYGPTTAVRPRLVNGAIDYTAAPTTVDLTNSNQFTYSRNVSQFGHGRFIFARLSFSL